MWKFRCNRSERACWRTGHTTIQLWVRVCKLNMLRTYEGRVGCCAFVPCLIMFNQLVEYVSSTFGLTVITFAYRPMFGSRLDIILISTACSIAVVARLHVGVMWYNQAWRFNCFYGWRLGSGHRFRDFCSILFIFMIFRYRRTHIKKSNDNLSVYR